MSAGAGMTLPSTPPWTKGHVEENGSQILLDTHEKGHRGTSQILPHMSGMQRPQKDAEIPVQDERFKDLHYLLQMSSLPEIEFWQKKSSNGSVN